ncbi:E3 ubiquitin-protein ligase TRIM56-like [Ptychodera flava]|uniref:E3 ubiquitin-protein ligase TRIM56-like n=1 Tax=Ptychodera flava TaxID=63121 RepID=UPI00396A53EA
MATAASSETREIKLLTDINEQILLCAICMERFKSPKILPCYHTFCASCLTKWVKTNNNQLICPTCKESWPLPCSGVPAIDNNRFMNDLLQVISDVNPGSGQTKAVCEGCGSEAMHWCTDCGQFFCEECVRIHRTVRSLKDHKLTTVGEYNEKMASEHFKLIQPRFCEKHTNTQLEFYCDSCQVPTCLKCTVVEHKPPNHDIISIDTALEKYMPVMKQYRGQVAQKVNDVRKARERFRDMGKDLKQKKVTAETQIKVIAKKAIQKIKRQESLLLSEVADKYSPKSKQIESKIELMDHKLVGAESMQSYLDHLLTFGGAVDIMAAKKVIGQRVGQDDLTEISDNDENCVLVFKENRNCLHFTLGCVEERDKESSTDRQLLKSYSKGSSSGKINQSSFTLRQEKLSGKAHSKLTDNLPRGPSKNTDSDTDAVREKMQGYVERKSKINTLDDKAIPKSSEHSVGASTLGGHSKTDCMGDGDCAICLDKMKNPRTLPCKHKFCRSCMDRSEKAQGPCCPVCKDVYGKITGNMPKGTMNVHVKSSPHIPGYTRWGCIEIIYQFPSGIQTEEHPNPGKRYTGTTRTAYLPNNDESQEVLRLLKIAFDRRLTFTIGTSMTTGATDTVIWNGISHKSSIYGGPHSYGYPDPDYLNRVKEELAAKGVK